MGRPILPAVQSDPLAGGLSLAVPSSPSQSDTDNAPPAQSASSPPSPVVAHLPLRPGNLEIDALSPSPPFRPASSGDVPGAKGKVVKAVRPLDGTYSPPPAPSGGLDNLESLSSALPTTSLPTAAYYAPNSADAYTGGETGYYTGEDGWEQTALGLTLPGAFEGGAKRRGTCKFFNAQKGFGFIVDDVSEEIGGDEVFVHYTAIAAVQGGPTSFRSLLEGEAVEYDMVQGGKGFQAQNVTGPGGVACIGTPPGAGISKQQPMSFTADRRTSLNDSRSGGVPRRPSGVTGSIVTTPARTRAGSAYYSSSSASPSTGNRSSYSSPASRPIHLPPPASAPSFANPYAVSPQGFQPYIVFPYGPPSQQPPASYGYPSEQVDGGENGRRPSQSQASPTSPYYLPQQQLSGPPPGAMMMQGAPDPRLFLPPHGYAVPAGGEGASSSYAGHPYPVSSSQSSSGTFSTPTSAYPVSSSQTSPGSHFLLPHPPPHPQQQFYPPPSNFAPPPLHFLQQSQQHQPPLHPLNANGYPISSSAPVVPLDNSVAYPLPNGYGGEAQAWAETGGQYEFRPLEPVHGEATAA